MDAAGLAKRQDAVAGAAHELCSRAADACRAAVAAQRRSEEAFDRTAAVLIGFRCRPFGDRDGGFLLRVGRSRPLVRFVRHDLRRWLERAGLAAEALSDVELACSEACANAVEHPRRASRQLVEVEAAIDDAELELRVRDFGVWNEPSGSTLRGRGLEMIRDLMDSFEVQQRADGTELVMRRSLAR